MQLSALMLSDVSGINQWRYVDIFEYTQGDHPRVYFMLIDATKYKATEGFNPNGQRYMPAAGAQLQVVLKSPYVNPTAQQVYGNLYGTGITGVSQYSPPVPPQYPTGPQVSPGPGGTLVKTCYQAFPGGAGTATTGTATLTPGFLAFPSAVQVLSSGSWITNPAISRVTAQWQSTTVYLPGQKVLYMVGGVVNIYTLTGLSQSLNQIPTASPWLLSGPVGDLYITNASVGYGFVIASTSAFDISDVSWSYTNITASPPGDPSIWYFDFQAGEDTQQVFRDMWISLNEGGKITNGLVRQAFSALPVGSTSCT